MKEETAKKAAKWWADQLRGCAKLDNGDNSETGRMTFMLASLAQVKEKQSQSPELIDAFESALTNIIMQNVYHDYVSFGVDYHPDAILRDAAQQAKLNLGMTTLPWKTYMWIEGDKVTVACGYGALPIEL